MADAQRHTEAWQDKPWKQFQRVAFQFPKCIYRASHGAHDKGDLY